MELIPELMGPGDGEKRCAVCGEVKPKTGFYFSRDSHQDDGWNPQCKECRKKYRLEQRNREIATNLKQVQANLLKEIADGHGRKGMVDLQTGAEVVLEAFGGIEGLAQKLATDYEASPIGTASRTKILLGVVALTTKAMEASQPVDVSSLPIETIQRLLKDTLGDEYRRIADQSEDSSPLVGEE